ncbi:MAG: DNA polymerase III subunit delta [Treponema sp.]|jgi:DNA polymerase-3 subunit delta|nr:DNA polymerase III subunit delta [Treponema sp.]
MQKNACWLFLGPEIGEKQDAVDAIRKSLSAEAGPGGSPAEETVYYAGDTPVADMVSSLRNGSLFADRRIFFIKNAEAIKKNEIDLLASYIASPSGDTVLIVLSEETRLDALEKAAPRLGKRVFYELTDSRKAGWVEDFFSRSGCRISGGGIQTILELVENNTGALRQECSRLLLFLGKDSEITGEDVEKWLSHTREESAFTLFSRIAEGDFSRGLESLRTLLAAKVRPPAIFAGLAWCFKTLKAYLALTEAGVRDEWEFKKIKVSTPRAKKDYASAGARYNSVSAETCVALTAEYDCLTRAAESFPEEILMEQYLYKIYSLSSRSNRRG